MRSILARQQTPVAAQGRGVRAILQAEGLLVLALCLLGYAAAGGDWATFALLCLLPDLSMVGYLVNARFGAVVYNLGHTYLAPALLSAVGTLLEAHQITVWALVWAAHIGFDRAMGYGLKYTQAFKNTHLQAPPDAHDEGKASIL